MISSTEWTAPQKSNFVPTFFVNITKFLSIKTKALKLYKEEMRSSPHSRSMKHAKVLAQHRGYTVGVIWLKHLKCIGSLVRIAEIKNANIQSRCLARNLLELEYCNNTFVEKTNEIKIKK